MRDRISAVVAVTLLAVAAPLLAQSVLPKQVEDAPHDISMVDAVDRDSAIATPLPESERKRLEKYDLPELAGSRQALGSQLMDGKLRRPLVDYVAKEGTVDQRISLFEGGLVIVRIGAGGATIRKKLLIPDDALKNYLSMLKPSTLAAIPVRSLKAPADGRTASIRIYADDRTFVERRFDPLSSIPKELGDCVTPLQDLMRAIAQDRTVTSSVANYEPKPGDLLVGDDQQTYEVLRIVDGIVQLRCLTQPTSLYVAKKDLYNYFIGSRRMAAK